MAFDVERARRETPGCSAVVHLNNAGAALPPAVVTDAVIEHLRLEARLGGYEAAEAAHQELQRTYDAIAGLIGCLPGEIALIENATRAWDMAFYSLPFGPGDRILTSSAEYASNAIAFLQVARRTGASVKVIDNDRHGQLDVDDLARRLDARVKLVSITYVPTQGGLVNPAAEVGALTRAAGVLFQLDACQAVGQLPVDVGELGCDILSGTSRKYLRGPRGVGFLYVSDRVVGRLEPPLLDMQAAAWTAPDRYEIAAGARRFESWESNVAGRVGLGKAVDYARSWGLPAIDRRVSALAATLREWLGDLAGVTVHDQGVRRCGIVTFTLEGWTSQEVQAHLGARGINTSVSRVGFARFDLEARGLPDLVRASVHYYNTEDELERLCAALPAPRPR